MSAKWRRSLQWDDAFFPSWAWPIKALLRLFSGIPLAVVLLSLVVVYAALASVPIGLLARLPTYAIVGSSLVVCSLVPGGLVAWRLARRSRVGLGLAAGAVVGVLGGVLWWILALPHLWYDWGTGEGFMLFADFCQRYSGTTLRRLPALEMTELEFYAWWPLQVILLAFVLNMVVATVRRIEFRFVNIGVLSVHTGIVLIALGSLYYGSSKREGETLLLAGPATPEGEMTPGPWEDVYYDSMRTAIHARVAGGSWMQLPLKGVPRYNDYNIEARLGETLFEGIQHALEAHDDGGRTLSIEAPDPPATSDIADLRFRVVGYCAYADDEPAVDWRRVDVSTMRSVPAGFVLNPVRVIEMSLPFANERGEPEVRSTKMLFLPRRPADRLVVMDDLEVEYEIERDPQRTADLLTKTPAGVRHALLVEVPEAGVREVYPLTSDFAEQFDAFDADAPAAETIRVGDTGWRVEVLALLREPPLKIVTSGYEGASSSVAVLRVAHDGGEAFRRWVYSRFPEITQDLLTSTTPDGRPRRRDADPAIRISYLDLTKIRFYLNEHEDGRLDLIIRAPDGEVTSIEDLGSHEGHADLLRVVERWEHAERFERPIPVPSHLQQKDQVGTHDRAQIALEITSTRYPDWKTLVWVPFTRYLDRSAHEAFRRQGRERWVRLPDGRALEVVFGRAWRRFESFRLRLLDFRMIEYAFRGAPRDYQSTVEVAPQVAGAFEPFVHTARLNAPLRAPFNVYDTRLNPVVRFIRRLLSGLDPRQYKLSQAGWDPTTWERTQQAVDRGELKRPFVTHTILHVGNNPGIHIIALGGILMALGIPWAFYVKPWLLRRAKRRIQRELARGGEDA